MVLERRIIDKWKDDIEDYIEVFKPFITIGTIKWFFSIYQPLIIDKDRT